MTNPIERAARALALALHREDLGDRNAPSSPASGIDENLVIDYLDQGATDLGYCVLAVLRAIRDLDLSDRLPPRYWPGSHSAEQAWRSVIDKLISEAGE
jgi:hypothetical protein